MYQQSNESSSAWMTNSRKRLKVKNNSSKKLWEIRKSPEQSQEAGLYPIAKDVLDFLEKASDLYRQSKTKNDPDPDGIDHSLM